MERTSGARASAEKIERRARSAWRPRSALAALALCAPCIAWADTQFAALGELSLEDLRDLRVLTVSRFEEALDAAAASVYVITGADIRRSGVRSLPEALRLAPMLDVARADGNQYAVSARGFTNVLANKMLVLIDGRPVYTPLFSGVFWEAQDVVLDDVERIEIVTGPSTALWGSNAVNGLIHVITKTAHATQGALLSAEAGNRRSDAAVRFGGSADTTGYRAYAKTYRRDDTRRANGSSVFDEAKGSQAGFRADWGSSSTRATLQGDAYAATIDQATTPRRLEGANLLARWEQLDAQGTGLTLQGLLEYARRNQPPLLTDTQRIADVVAQFSFQPLAAHRVLVGGGYRHVDDRVSLLGSGIAFMPASRELEWSRLFVQDQIALGSDVSATLAASAEHNPFTGLEWLPSVRLAWQPRSGAVLWASASRAVRSPSRIDREYFQPATPPYLVAGGPDFQSEVSNVFEVGARAEHGKTLSYAATFFRHEHQRLRSLAPTADGLQWRNDVEGHTQGLEGWVRWSPSSNWRIDAGGVLLRQRLALRPGAVDSGGLATLGNDPKRWGSLRAAVDLTPSIGWQTSVRRVGARSQPGVPAYTAFDTRLAWRIDPSTELALKVENAFDRRHAEWGTAANRVELERSASVQLTLRY